MKKQIKNNNGMDGKNKYLKLLNKKEQSKLIN